MRFAIPLLAFTLLSFISKGPIGTYYRNTHDVIEIKADHTFNTWLSGGCDGRIESKGKWKVNKDTLICSEIESRMMDDPWKKSGGQMKYILKKGVLIPFYFNEGKMAIDENNTYKKSKKAI